MRQEPPPPPAPVYSSPPRTTGIGGFWSRRSTGGKAAIVIVVLFVLAGVLNPRPAAPAVSDLRPATSQAPAVTSSPAPVPTARAVSDVAAPSPSLPEATVTPAPERTPRVIVVPSRVTVDDDRTALRGKDGTYVWSAVRIKPDEVRLGWNASAGRRACVVRWTVNPDRGATISRAIRLERRDDASGSRDLDTARMRDATVTVTSTCPEWRLTLAEAPQPRVAVAANCHPSYSGACLKQGRGDYDCAGGSGDGPNYIAGPVRVVGRDEFGLDYDHDGWGCES